MSQLKACTVHCHVLGGLSDLPFSNIVGLIFLIFIFFTVLGLSCGTQDLCFIMQNL